MKLCIIGAGYVGLVTGACFADLGNQVICVDNDETKIKLLSKGQTPIFEPGLDEIVKNNIKRGSLVFSTQIAAAVKKSDIIFIAVGTPPRSDGEADLSAVENVASKIAKSMDSYKLVVEKSTVPVNTGEWVKRTISMHNSKKIKFDVASNPEFLREGSAINDFMHPDRIVIGVETKRSESMLQELYAPLNAPIVVTDIKSAEIIKHASNSFLATKISFANAVANVCDLAGADIIKVVEGMGFDKRIGKEFLNAGIGFGGSCFPKDLSAFLHISSKLGYDFHLLKSVEKINKDQVEIFIRKIENTMWILQNKTVTVFGLSFKPNTDDMREAPSIRVIDRLLEDGAKVKVYDPEAMPKAKSILKKVTYCDDPYKACKGSDCLIIVTEWNQFRELDMSKIKKFLKHPIVIDGRNIYEPEKMRQLGFEYVSMGRGKKNDSWDKN